MSIYQLLRYSLASLIDGISNGYTLTTIHESKPWVFFVLKFLITFIDISIKWVIHFQTLYKMFNVYFFMNLINDYTYSDDEYFHI